MNHKVDDNYWHIWSPPCFWGDQMFHLMAAKLSCDNKDIIIHTGKSAWCSHTETWHLMDSNVFTFWRTLNCVKGIIFDIEATEPIELRCEESNYKVKQGIPVPKEKAAAFTYDIRQDINFSLFPSRSSFSSNSKIAVFQPVSLSHRKSDNLKSEYIHPWDRSIEALLDKGYEIVAIGNNETDKELKQFYPDLLNKYPITNLIGSTTIFESIDLVMNRADFVLSCDSWAAWYGIASRKKTAASLGDHGCEAYVRALGNQDIYKISYSKNGEICDLNLAEWIKEHA